MDWDVSQIQHALAPADIPFDRVELRLFDQFVLVGVGVGHTGSAVLLFGGEANGTSMKGAHFSYEPWATVFTLEGEVLTGVGLLQVNFPNLSAAELDALSTVFAGLVYFCRSGVPSFRVHDAIRALANLFENRMKQIASDLVIRGLFAELLILFVSSDPDWMVSTWHSGPDNKFDFSANDARLEVKSTIKMQREHMFSSSQTTVGEKTNVLVASVLLSQVEEGVTLSGLVSQLNLRLKLEVSRAKVLQVCLTTLGTPIYLSDLLKFDLESSLATIELFELGEIPTPVAVAGVLDMHWTAVLSQRPVARATGPFARNLVNL